MPFMQRLFNSQRETYFLLKQNAPEMDAFQQRLSNSQRET